MTQPSYSADDRPAGEGYQAGLRRFFERHRSTWELGGIWLVLRLVTFVWAALVSPLHAITPVEQMVPLWPPSTPLLRWLERTLLAPWFRRDAVNHVGIVVNGYRLDDGSTQFHPLFAWLAKPIYWLFGHPTLALLVVSSLATIALLIIFEQLVLLDLESHTARTATLLFIFSPPAFILFAPYTESLFLLWAVLCLFWARKQRWWLAGLAGALATLTRQQGIFLLFPLAWELWQVAGRNPRRALAGWRDWLALTLIPGGLLFWVAYRAVALNDVRPDYSSLQAFVYSVIISPASSKVVPVQAFWLPWRALWFALNNLWAQFHISVAIDLVLGAGFLLLLGLAWRHMRVSYRIYAVIIVLVSFAYHTGPFLPYMGLPRHLLLAFPVFIGLGPVLRYRWQRLLMVGLGLFGMLFLLMLYVIRGWVP